MTERFAPAAGRLAGLAGRVLGWKPPEFWAATPAELAAILRPLANQTAEPSLSRSDLTRLMEQEHD